MSYSSHYSKDSSTYQSTVYQPVNTNSAPHITSEGVKNESFVSSNTGCDSVAIDGLSRPLGFRSIRWWLVEILASIVSVAALITIIIIVIYYRGRGLEDIRLPSQLNLNSLVALLSTICRVALMIPVASVISQEVWTWLYESHEDSINHRQLQDLELSDEASRSAWGSFKFLLQTRRNWLAYIASLLTLVTLVFGTFTQQLLTVKPFPVSDPTYIPGSLPRSELWSEYSGRPVEGVLQPPLSLKAATYNSALTGSATTLTANCPTGNCTWPVTPSVAICGACVNSTWQLKCGGNPTPDIGFGCQYVLPSGGIANITNIGGSVAGVGFQVFPSVGHTYKKSRTDVAYIANFEAVGAPNNSHKAWEPANNSLTVASECALWMCIQAYETKYANAVQTQTVVNEYYTVDNTSKAGDWEYDINFVSIPSEFNTMSTSVYSIYSPALMALREYYDSLFNGNITLGVLSQTPTSDIIAGIWNSSADLDSWIKSLAAGLSNVIRTSQSSTPTEVEFYQGTGFQLGYDIRWPWIILPAISVCLSLFVLLVMMFRTAKSPVRAWKGSPLALLFTEVDPELRKKAAGSTDKFEGIKKETGKARVMLEDRGYGKWRIRPA